jgi:transposase
MSKARLIITAVVVEGRSQHEVARTYGISQSWVSRLVARYYAEGEAAFQPRSRRPKTSPTAIPPATVTLITELRDKLTSAGVDAGPDTIAWHLAHHQSIRVSAATISRYLTRLGLVTPSPPSAPRPPTSGSKQSCRTNAGRRTSPTTRSPAPTMYPPVTPRS